jgi:hypothetical protein
MESERKLRELHLPATAVLTALAIATSGCFLGKNDSPAGAALVGDVPVQVVNHHWLDVTIYVIHDGQRTRLGVAGGSAETQMVLPFRLLGIGRDLRLYGDPIGSSERAITGSIVVQPGQFIEWLLESQLERSTVGVY